MFLAGEADRCGRHDFVGEGVGESTPCWWMPDLVREGVLADDGLVGRAAEADDFAEHLRGGCELVHDDVAGEGIAVVAHC